MKYTALIGISLLLLSGCASMEQAISPEMRFGQLYALEGALTEASMDCGNPEASHTATYWASSTVTTLREYSRFLQSDSAAHLKSRELVKQLNTLAYHHGSEQLQCERLAQAGDTARELLHLLTVKRS